MWSSSLAAPPTHPVLSTVMGGTNSQQRDSTQQHAIEPEQRYADKFRGYVAKPEVIEIYATMKTCAKAIDVTNSAVKFLAKPKVMSALTKNLPPGIAVDLAKIGMLAGTLGPAGVALGTGVDLMVAFGLLERPTMKKLDEISRQIEGLKNDIVRNVKGLLQTERVLYRFLPTYDKMLANVQIFERIVVWDGDIDAHILSKRLEDMVEDYPPSRIISDLKQMHNLITGEAGFNKPLFDQLAEGNELEGEDMDQFVLTRLLQFQIVVGLEMRAVRMLRSLIAHQNKDETYFCDMKAIFSDLFHQLSKHHPFLKYEWYLRFRVVGGTFEMTTMRWPNYYVYMSSLLANVRGCNGHPGDQGVFIITPCSDGTYLLSPKEWPNWYVSIPEKDGVQVSLENPVGLDLATPAAPLDLPAPNLPIAIGGFDVTGDKVRRDRWRFTVKDIGERKLVVTDAQRPDFYMYMRGDFFGSIKCDKGDPGSKGTFILKPQQDPDTEWYLNFRAFGGTFTMATTARPGWHVYTDRDDDTVRGIKCGRGHRFIITPRDGGTFLIQTERTPTLYLYMKDNSTGDVKGCTGDPGPQGYWCIECTDVRKCTLIMSTAKWPNWYMYMVTDDTAKVRGERGDPGPKGHFILH